MNFCAEMRCRELRSHVRAAPRFPTLPAALHRSQSGRTSCSAEVLASLSLVRASPPKKEGASPKESALRTVLLLFARVTIDAANAGARIPSSGRSVSHVWTAVSKRDVVEVGRNRFIRVHFC